MTTIFKTNKSLLFIININFILNKAFNTENKNTMVFIFLFNKTKIYTGGNRVVEV